MKNGKYELQQAPFAVVGYPPQQPEEQLSEKIFNNIIKIISNSITVHKYLLSCITVIITWVVWIIVAI